MGYLVNSPKTGWLYFLLQSNVNKCTIRSWSWAPSCLRTRSYLPCGPPEIEDIRTLVCFSPHYNNEKLIFLYRLGRATKYLPWKNTVGPPTYSVGRAVAPASWRLILFRFPAQVGTFNIILTCWVTIISQPLHNIGRTVILFFEAVVCDLWFLCIAAIHSFIYFTHSFIRFTSLHSFIH